MVAETVEIRETTEEKRPTFAEVLRAIQGSRSEETLAGILGIRVPTLYTWRSPNFSHDPRIDNVRKLLSIATPEQGCDLLHALDLVPESVSLLIDGMADGVPPG